MFRVTALATIAAVVGIAVFGTPNGDASAPGVHRTAPGVVRISALAGHAPELTAGAGMAATIQRQRAAAPARDGLALPARRAAGTCPADAGGG